MLEGPLLTPLLCGLLAHDDATIVSILADNNKLHNDGAVQVAQLLKQKNTSLETLSLKGNTEVPRTLLSLMSYYTELNRMTKKDAKFKELILRVERNDPSVRDVLLKGMGHIDDGAFRCICQALAKNREVRTLNVSGNALSDAGAKFFLTLLTVNQTLVHVDLTNNRFSPSAIAEMRRAVVDSSLQKLLL